MTICSCAARTWLLAAIGSLSCVHVESRADYNASVIPTVGWLVDNSDTIAVCVPDETAEGEVRVVRWLKGAAEDLQFPLKNTPMDRGNRGQVSRDGLAAYLVYVRQGSEILETVPFIRKVSYEPARLDAAIYGVSELGNVYLTEGDLLRAIDERIKQNEQVPASASEGQQSETLVLRAPLDFPLETSGDTYMLKVTKSPMLRDHYIEALKKGDALTRIIAISQLKSIGGGPSRKAIASAMTAETCEPSFRPNQWHQDADPTDLLTIADVRESAKSALSTSP